MKVMMNITDCSGDTGRYRNGFEAWEFAGRFGCDGFELMHCAGGNEKFFPAEAVEGVHLRFFSHWLDLWNGDLNALEREYDTLENVKNIFGGLERSCILCVLEEDLERAKRLGASYVVFHVSDVKDSELFTYRFSHTDEEVIDRAAQLVNLLLDGKDYEFEFLMENLWWPGFTMTNPVMTGRLLEKVHYPKKGIMLDTGHLMHANLELKTQEEAVEYILEKVRAHKDLARYIRGIHLNQSLTGEYVKKLLSRTDGAPERWAERAEECYRHLFAIDSHLPFTAAGVREMVREINPAYLVYEFISKNRAEHEEKLRAQSAVFAYHQ